MSKVCCNDCGISKDVSEFYTNGRHKDGTIKYMGICKECHLIRCHERHARNKVNQDYVSTRNARSKAYYEANRKEVIATHKEYYKVHKAHIQRYEQMYSAFYAEDISNKKRDYLKKKKSAK